MADGDRRRRARVASPSRLGGRDDGFGPAWYDEDGAADRASDVGSDLVSLGFIRSSLRRTRRARAAVTVVGLLLGVALAASRPPTPQASTTLLLTVGPEGQPGTAILTDQAMAQSRGVAALAAQRLGRSADSVLPAYKAEVLTDRILRITASASSSGEAASMADAIAKAFLVFRAAQLQQQDKLQADSLDAVLALRQRAVDDLNKRISRLDAEPPSSSRQAQLDKLQPIRDQATTELVVLKNDVEATKASADNITAAMVGKSRILDSASQIARSRVKPVVLLGAVGMVLAYFLSAAFIIVGALISDRLRRRDDVAMALDAPVSLSIAARSGRRLLGRHTPRAHGRDVRRIVTYLQGVLPTDSGRRALAVIPIDEAGIAAVAVLSLASSLAQQGNQVIVADMVNGAPAAKLAGARKPGIQTVSVDGAQISMSIPDPDDVPPVGPLSAASGMPRTTPAAAAHADYANADVLLTLITLDPSQASDHLKTWASDAVVVVTSGRSSWTKIHAVGELIRLSGTRLVSAVLVGADKWDESLGVSPVLGPGRDAAPSGANVGAEARSPGGYNAWRFISR